MKITINISETIQTREKHYKNTKINKQNPVANLAKTTKSRSHKAKG